MPLVSVIIPNYNHANYLKQRIDSILDQTFQDFELIILDDHSTDDSRKIIESYSGNEKITHIVYNTQNSGSPFKQWEKGIGLATGDYTWIAESDDWAEPEFLEEMLETIQTRKNIGIAFCNSNWMDAEGKMGKSLSIYKESFIRKGIDEITNSLLKFNTIQNVSAALMCTGLLRRSLDKASKYKACGDLYIYIQMLANADLAFNEKKLNNFRWYTNNVSNAAYKSGLWVTEGISILENSTQILGSLSRADLKQLFHYWMNKINGLRKTKFYYYRAKLWFIFLPFYFKPYKKQASYE